MSTNQVEENFAAYFKEFCAQKNITLTLLGNKHFDILLDFTKNKVPSEIKNIIKGLRPEFPPLILTSTQADKLLRSLFKCRENIKLLEEAKQLYVDAVMPFVVDPWNTTIETRGRFVDNKYRNRGALRCPTTPTELFGIWNRITDSDQIFVQQQ